MRQARNRRSRIARAVAQTHIRRVVQVRKEAVLEVEVAVRQIWQPASVDEEPTHDEDRLVVRCRRIAKHSQIPGFIDETELQVELQIKLWPPMVAIGSAAHGGVGNHAEAWLLRAT